MAIEAAGLINRRCVPDAVTVTRGIYLLGGIYAPRRDV